MIQSLLVFSKCYGTEVLITVRILEEIISIMTTVFHVICLKIRPFSVAAAWEDFFVCLFCLGLFVFLGWVVLFCFPTSFCMRHWQAFLFCALEPVATQAMVCGRESRPTANKQGFIPPEAQLELMLYLMANNIIKTNNLQPVVELHCDDNENLYQGKHFWSFVKCLFQPCFSSWHFCS